MRKFGLIGFPLGHSFSKGYFTNKFENERILNCAYDNYPIEDINQLDSVIENNPELIGLNVTIPYKQKVIPCLNEIDEVAALIGAVNTIRIYRTGEKYTLKGYNTDAWGFEQPLLEHLSSQHKNALVFGTGGASKAVIYILAKHQINYTYVSRTASENQLSYSQLTEEIISENTLLINTSPVGMYPIVNACPDIPYKAITSSHILYDLVYNPEKTKFLQMGELKKATLINGLPMLYAQAEKAWQIWNL